MNQKRLIATYIAGAIVLGSLGISIAQRFTAPDEPGVVVPVPGETVHTAQSTSTEIIQNPGQKPAPVPISIYTNFDTPVSLRVEESIIFTDGLQVTLATITDSRCPPDVQCVWAGEIGAILTAKGGAAQFTGIEVRLGTETAKHITIGGYTFALVGATADEVILSVSPRVAVPEPVAILDAGYVRGHVTLGPFCPVMQEGVPCDVPSEAYTSRTALVYKEDGMTVHTKVPLDTKGDYTISLDPGTYWVQIEPAGIGAGEKKQVIIAPLHTSVVDFDIDTGIR